MDYTIMNAIASDLRQAIRSMRRSLVSSAFIVVLLGVTLGIAASAGTTFAALFRTHPIPNIDAVAHLYRVRPGEMFSLEDHAFIKDHARSFSELVAWARTWQVIRSQSNNPERLPGEIVGPDYFEFLQARPVIGRLLQPQDHLPTAAPVIVLSEGVWRRLFQSDALIVGKTLTVGDTQVAIVGVAEMSIRGLAMPNVSPTAFWIPLQALSAVAPDGRWSDPDFGLLRITARLARGTSFPAASQELAQLADRLNRSSPLEPQHSFAQPYHLTRAFRLRPALSVRFSENRDGTAIPLGYAVLALVLLSFFTGAFSIATFRAGQLALKAEEMAIREALGSTRARLVRCELSAGVFRTIAAAALSVWVAYVGISLTRKAFIAWRGFTLDFPLAFDLSTVTCIAGGALIGLIVTEFGPVWLAPRRFLTARLTWSASSAGEGRWRRQRSIVGFQVCMAAFLILIAAACVREVYRQTARDSGIDLDKLAVVQLDFRQQRIENGRARRIITDVLERVQRLPGVESAAIASGLPLGLSVSTFGRITVPQRPLITGIEEGIETVVLVSSDEVFSTFGTPIIHGRGFGPHDVEGSERVAVLSANTAERLFGTTASLGQYVIFRPLAWRGEVAHGQTYRVIGVAKNTDVMNRGDRETAIIYLPFTQNTDRVFVVAARTSGKPQALIDRMKHQVWAADPEIAIFSAGTGVEQADATDPVLRIITGLLVPVAASSMVLCVTALVAVLIQSIAVRRHEIAVRMTLGAGRGRTIRDIVGAALIPVLLGTVAAAAGYFILLRLTHRFIYLEYVGLSSTSLIMIIVAVLVGASVACYWPARSAAALEPMSVLRQI